MVIKSNSKNLGCTIKETDQLFPTKIHQSAATEFVSLFSKDKNVMAILLTCSCDRGKAEKSSCVDFALVVNDYKYKKALEKKFEEFKKTSKNYKKLDKFYKYTHIDLDIINGVFKPKRRWATSSPIEYELELGNFVAYSVIMLKREKYFSKIKKKYLPYYDEKLRRERLKGTKKYLFNNLDHIDQLVERKLYFHAYDRLYKALQEFLQAFSIKIKFIPYLMINGLRTNMLISLNDGMYTKK